MRLRAKDIEEAASEQHLCFRPWSPEPAVNIARAMEELRCKGIQLVRKKSWSIKPDMTTAYHRRLRLSVNWDDKSDDDKAATLGHELVHYRQRAAFGRHRFNAQYIFRPRRRLIIEIQAYRESMRIHLAQGATRDQLLRYANRVVRNFRNSYALFGVKGKVADTVRQLLMAEAA